jgi:hypothetical protein
MHLAEATIWLALACILASFDILPPINPDTGKDKVPEEVFLSGFTRQDSADFFVIDPLTHQISV